MRLLLDTHILLWLLKDSPRLGQDARHWIMQADEIYVSTASIWEIAIKAGLGKLQADATKVANQLQSLGFQELPVRNNHAAAVQNLHHRDPFDPLLIAQAISEPMRLLTADARLAQYSELVILCPAQNI
ncbi:type II toxin-antitoxin system VapC family toxin [Telmatobacter bradus]|uniref:type II toxin-antitoxin system VapC family toxin n=1 Tax=Telmatobacter bradus TaxID=474953 RepID=UPI003B433EFC